MDIKPLYEAGSSIPEISALTRIPKSTVRKILIDSGAAIRSRNEAIRLAAARGKLGAGLRGKKRPLFSEQWRMKIREARLKNAEKYAKGVCKKPSGYVEYTRGPHKGRSVHVVMMEIEIGRRLFSNECVHHINGIRDDNRIENLELMTRAQHASLHGKENSHKRQRTKQGRFK